jgi:aspartate kinase
MSAYLNEVGVSNQLVDVRDLLRTDDNFRDAGVDWTVSKLAVDSWLLTEEKKLMAESNKPDDNQRTTNNTQPNIIITQGFIGSTDANESTTLGREGSDYSAAIFANVLDAESLTIWKDVEGVMSADPKEFTDATYLEALSYFEIIEMAYYGAQVIHPKTIKPLQNKQIPLYVKSFINPQLPGTVISKKNGKNLPPIKIVKPNQVIVFLSSQDFSFVGEEPMSKLYQIFNMLHIKPNLIQTGAINIQICVDDHAEKIDQLAAAASELFHVQIERGLSLLTIRHYTEDVLQSMIAGKEVELVQKTPSTVQVLYKN